MMCKNLEKTKIPLPQKKIIKKRNQKQNKKKTHTKTKNKRRKICVSHWFDYFVHDTTPRHVLLYLRHFLHFKVENIIKQITKKIILKITKNPTTTTTIQKKNILLNKSDKIAWKRSKREKERTGIKWEKSKKEIKEREEGNAREKMLHVFLPVSLSLSSLWILFIIFNWNVSIFSFLSFFFFF